MQNRQRLLDIAKKICTLKPDFAKETITSSLPEHPELIKIIPAVRMALADERLLSIQFSNSIKEKKASDYDSQLTHLQDNDANYLRSGVLIIEDASKEDMTGFTISKIQKHIQKNKQKPFLIVFSNLGVIGIGENPVEAELVLQIFNAFHSLPSNAKESQTSELAERTLLEQFPSLFPQTDIPVGRVEQKIIIVTGAAQGFGKGIVDQLFIQGANVVISDIDEDKGIAFSSTLNTQNKNNKALFVKTDVASPDSVGALIQKTVVRFGGLDAIISNAGILVAGSLDEMSMEVFDKVTKVNYHGYFNCTKYASEVMKIQAQHNSTFYYDIIQINSKSGLEGSNKNFTYAGGKFGGIGLTQSFALELIEHRTKVNAICPGNFFEGPLWSDPEKGLFVQYLNAGKVPGANTIEDVKRFYEEKVPLKRGCKVEDVAKAIFYIIDQEYETGQAVPVTGGQVMLH